MIRIYTINNCPYCGEIKNKLKESNIDFFEVNVDLSENQAEFDKLYEITKSNDVPMVKIKNEIFVPKVSFNTIDELFQLIKIRY